MAQTRTIRNLYKYRRELRQALRQQLIDGGGVQSASISSAGNSQSYTRLSPDELRKEIVRVEQEIALATHGGLIRRVHPSYYYGNWMGV